jgi:hypothetical protein
MKRADSGELADRPRPKWFDSAAFENPGSRMMPIDIPAPLPANPVRQAQRVLEVTDRRIARLVPVALELAQSAGIRGIIAGEIRAEAARRGIITGHEGGRTLSYLSQVPRAAGLIKLGSTKRRLDSKLFPQSHSNDHQVYVHPDFAP